MNQFTKRFLTLGYTLSMALGVTAVCSLPTHAALSEPDTVIYGQSEYAGALVTAQFFNTGYQVDIHVFT